MLLSKDAGEQFFPPGVVPISVYSPPQLFQQCPGVLEVGGVKALGEPAVDRCQQIAGLIALALALPQLPQAHRRSQLPRLGLLAAGYSQCLLEAGFGPGCVWGGLPPQQFSVQSMQL